MTSQIEQRIADRKLAEFMSDGNYLPPRMRDFHDQKEIFAAMHGLTGWNEKEGWARQISWMDGQIYTIDLFLHFMARHGYTLQRSRARVPFHDLDEKIARHRREERDAFAAMLAAEKAKNAASAQPTEKVEEKPRNLADLLTRNLRNED